MKGKIICIEGTDGSGKQTQTNLLYNYLKDKGINVVRQSFPNYEYDSSVPVRQYLSGEFGETANCLDAYQASILFSVDRLLTYNKFLKEHYENGGYIIFDRYVSSNMIHQAGKIEDKMERDKYLEWLDDLEYGKLKLPRPDQIIFLDVPVEVSKKLANARESLKNKSKKDIHEQDLTHLQKAHDCGEYVAKKFGWGIIKCNKDNESLYSIEEIFDMILKKINLSNL